MFCVVFEVRPAPGQHDAYLAMAQRMRGHVERIPGFLSVERFASRAREGWLLSLQFWRDEAALTRWRAHAAHHTAQEQGRERIFADYRLRVGQVVRDAAPGQPARAPERRSAWNDPPPPGRILGMAELDAVAEVPEPFGAERWDSLYTQGRSVLLAPFDDEAAGAAWQDRMLAGPAAPSWVRLGEMERDYGMFDRDEAPQYFPPRAAG